MSNGGMNRGSRTNSGVSRRRLIKQAAAAGVGAPALAGLLSVPMVQTVGAQGTTELSFDAGATAGGGGKPNAAAIEYCYIVNGGSQFELNRMVDSRLVTVAPNLTDFVGEIAESWKIEGTTATFNLRKNAKWHDGQPVTAKDVVFTINVIADPASTSRWASSLTSIKGFKEAQSTAGTPSAGPTTLSGVTAPDDYTVVIELTQPDSALLPGFMFINIMPEHILGSVDRAKLPENSFWTKNRIGSGPFKFKQLVEGQRVELEAFDDYYLGRPKIDKLNLLFFSSVETSLAAFQQQTNLVAPMTVLNLDLVKKLNYADIQTTAAGVGALEINTKLPDFADKRVRQAMSYAIDRKTICEQLFQGYADPVSTELPYLKWTQPADANPYDYDPDKAKQLLKDAGWKGGTTYTLWYYYPDQVTSAVVQAMQQYLEAVGIKTAPRFDDGSGVRTKQFNDHTWQLTYGSYGAQPAPSALNVIFSCAQSKLWTYCNPAFDEAMTSARGTYDQAEQGKFYQQAIKILNEDLPWIWLFDRKNLIAVDKQKLTLDPQGAWAPAQIMYHNYAETWTVNS